MTDEEKKERNKEYRDKPENKEKIKARNKKYKEENKEKIKTSKKKYKEENKEKIKTSNKAYKEKPENKEKIKAKRQTPEGIKCHKISSWKNDLKIISNDWDATYEWVMNTKNCENCDVLLENGTGSKGKCLDHDHTITDGPNTRAVLCMPCNIHEGHKRHASKEDCDKHYNEKIKCECGSTPSRINMNKHKKTRKHINFHINLNS